MGDEPRERWTAAECPFSVEYPAELMMRLRQRAVESFHALANGGLETGGVLFGRVLPNARMMQRVELAAERPIACAHASGPAFILSEEEKPQVAALIDSGRSDREIAGLSVVGFWVAHGRSALAPTLYDLELYGQLFPNPWQVILVVKPQSDGVPKASFFFRSGSGVAPHRRQHEFFLDPGFRSAASDTADVADTADAAGPAVSQEKYKPIPKERRTGLTPRRQEDGPTLAGPPTAPPATRLVTRPVLIALLVGLLLGFALRSVWGSSAATAQRDRELNLELFEAGQELLVHWNGRSWQVDNARNALLIVESGGLSKALPLTSRDLVTGYLRLSPPNGDTTVTLQISERNGKTEQQQRFWIPGVAGAPKTLQH